MSATRCPKCGGSGWTSLPALNGGSSTASLSQSCNACQGVGVIYEPAPVINVHVTIMPQKGEGAGAIAKQVAAEVRKALGEQNHPMPARVPQGPPPKRPQDTVM
jgi:DnaJ-class molecular chaperone